MSPPPFIDDPFSKVFNQAFCYRSHEFQIPAMLRDRIKKGVINFCDGGLAAKKYFFVPADLSDGKIIYKCLPHIPVDMRTDAHDREFQGMRGWI